MLNFTRSGNGKETLVLLHGFMENSTIWDEMEPHLSADFNLVKIDLPGHGGSPIGGEDLSLEMMAQEVKKVTDELTLQEFHLLGHSMGGYVLLAFAQQFPKNLQSLTLFFSTYFADDAEKKEQRRKSLKIIDQNFPAFVKAGISNLFSANEKDILEGKINHAEKIALSTPKEGAAAAVKAMMNRPDRSQVLRDFQGKILVLAGRHDTAVNGQRTLAGLPDETRIKAYEIDCGHNGHWEKPAVCAAIINTELLHNLPKKLVF